MAATEWNYNKETRKHSCRMRTARSPAIRVEQPATRCQDWEAGDRDWGPVKGLEA